MTLTKYGRREWISMTVLVAAAVVVSLYSASPRYAWSLVTIVPLAAFWGWVLWFFRDPKRYAPTGAGLFVSPADGRVTDVTPVGADSPLGQTGLKIGIFMSVFDVHVNRSPAAVVVEHVEHRPGVFLDARDPLASERNESATVFLRYRSGGCEHRVVIRQIAGLIARRIVTDLKPGQSLQGGERIGMIKFGSRMELFVPDVLRPRAAVKIGDHVRAGETVIVAAQAGEASDTTTA